MPMLPVAQRHVPVIAGRKPLRLQAHMRYAEWGDSITSQAGSRGFSNWVNQICLRMGGFFRPCVSPSQGLSGDTLTQMLARATAIYSQVPEVVFLMGGHNDGASAGAATLSARWDLLVDALWAVNPRIIVIAHGMLPSSVESTAPLQQAVVDFNLHILARQNLVADTVCPLIYIPVPTGWDPNTANLHTIDGTHPNFKGGSLLGANGAAVLMANANWINILTEANPPPSIGANLDTEAGLTGTTGTKTGTVTPTGNVATGKEVNNGTVSVVVCDNQTIAGDQRIDITGANTPTTLVTWDEASSSNVTISSAIGDFFEYVMGFDISATDGVSVSDGFHAIQMNFSNFGSTMSTTDLIPSGYGDVDAAIFGAAMRTNPINVFVATSTISPQFVARISAGAVDTRLTLRKSIMRKVELTPYGLPYYTGAHVNKATNSTQKVTGTGVSGTNITAATVATLTLQPGDWSGGAIVWTRAMRVNGATVGGAFSAGWTYAAGGTLTAGQSVEFDVTATNLYGTVTRTVTYTVV